MPVSLADRLARAAAEHPDAVAVEDERVRLTYRQFWHAALGLAADLDALPPGGLLLSAQRSAEGVLAYWAALLAGRRITPVSPSWPASRRAALAGRVGAVGLLVVDGPTVAGLVGVDLRLALDRVADRSPAGPLPAPPPDDADAYVLFTSGSTGRPKGVRISRAALTGYVEVAGRSTGLGPGDRVSHTIDYTFDPCVFDVFATLAHGATVCVPHPGERLRPVAFATRARLTHWCSVPSLIGLAERLGSLRPGAMPTLRHSMFLGEALLRPDAERWRRAAPGSVLVNAYGPTELTNTCTEYRLEVGAEIPQTPNGTVPIGAAYPGLEWGLLGFGAADSSTGELVMRGRQRLTSYLEVEDNADRFAERLPDAEPGQPAGWRPLDTVPGAETGVPAEFGYRTGDLVVLTPDGLVHLGRVDRQVKVRGQRVEPAEVEHLLRGLPGIDRVVVLPDGQGLQTRLVAVVEADVRALPGAVRETWPAGSAGSDGPAGSDGSDGSAGSAGSDGGVWRVDPWPDAPGPAALRAELPSHMVPARWVALSRLPSNDRGKLDYHAIRELAGLAPR